MAIVDKAWDGSPSRWPDTPSFCDSSLINLKTGDRAKWTLNNCKLPVREPDGDINANAVHSAVAALAGARGGLKGVSSADKKTAARALVKIYNEMKEPLPPSLKQLAQ